MNREIQAEITLEEGTDSALKSIAAAERYLEEYGQNSRKIRKKVVENSIAGFTQAFEATIQYISER